MCSKLLESAHQSLVATPQCPAVSIAGLPLESCTLKPSEQRRPWPQIASPPPMTGRSFPLVRLKLTLSPKPRMTEFSLSSAAPVTVGSAVTRTRPLRGSIRQAVPAIRADLSSWAVTAFSSEVRYALALSEAAVALGAKRTVPATSATAAPAVSPRLERIRERARNMGHLHIERMGR